VWHIAQVICVSSHKQHWWLQQQQGSCLQDIQLYSFFAIRADCIEDVYLGCIGCKAISGHDAERTANNIGSCFALLKQAQEIVLST